MELQYAKVLAAVAVIVNEGRPWQDKRDDFIAYAAREADSTLAEFLGWFDEAALAKLDE